MNPYSVQIKIMPLKELLDPQGKAIEGGLVQLGLSNISHVRMGKHLTMQIEAPNADDARAVAVEACKKLLCNLVMEQYEIGEIEEIKA